VFPIVTVQCSQSCLNDKLINIIQASIVILVTLVTRDVKFVFFLKFELQLLKFKFELHLRTGASVAANKLHALFLPTSCMTTQVARDWAWHCLPASSNCLLLQLRTSESVSGLRRAQTVQAFFSHAVAMRPRLRWQVWQAATSHQ